MKELVKYLAENVRLDFPGEITIEQVRAFLREDDSRESRALLGKLIEDKGIDDLLLTLADVLQEYLRSGINEDVIREQLVMYSDS